MKKISLLPLLLLLIATQIKAQETVKELSKQAYKGYLYDVKNTNNALSITYKIPGEKKNSDALFETYSFDAANKFVKVENTNLAKEEKPDVTVTQFYAYVGGTSSFDVLSMKLKLSRKELLKSWSHEKQAYIVSKVLQNEAIKPKNDNGKTYKGYASFVTETQGTQDDLFILAANDNKDKKLGNQYYVLNVNSSLEVKETPVDLAGAQTLVYCDQLQESNDIAMVFAPEKGNGDASSYTYFRYSQKGEFKTKVAFKSPSTNLLIMNVNEAMGSVYFCGTSTKSTDAYGEVFSEHASIYNPGFTQGGENKVDMKWQKNAEEKMSSFHLLKFTGNQLDFASTAAIDAFKSKFVASGKGASVYKGNKFIVERFFVTPNQEYLIAGQLTGSVNMGMGNPVKTYEDLVCLYFDKAGQLKTQFGVGKLNNDKKSEIFDMLQDFRLSKDGKSVYWEIKEVKGVKGYQSFLSAYSGGSPSLYAVYFPRIAKIDLAANTISEFKTLGDENYYLRKDFQSYFNKAENSVTYIGHDEDFKKLWLAKYVFE
ncbi:hypothetical protein ACFQZS_03390 [Mucilaginibacter calamicampi]|uniref:Uncharacterized protein n=1 Tax=Mucilaginibacter calamicampi TaxID=1302352 RepID=A0ABW2YTH8_9SPHI